MKISLSMPYLRIYKSMKIHFIGICGVSMQALAAFARARGNVVTGSDTELDGHNAKLVDGADLVVYTNAVPLENPELDRARMLGIPTVERAVYLGRLSRTFNNVIAVGGCHGKSTATAMLGEIFKDATVHVGVAGASRCGNRKLFITEACEYKESFLKLSPDLAIVLNAQYDHPDYYSDEKALLAAYRRFCFRSSRTLVNGDDPACRALAANAYATFGTGKDCDFRAENIATENGEVTFDFVKGATRKKVRLSVAGEHNALNALAALAAASICGADVDKSIANISDFTGLPRRFQRLGTAFGKTVYTDYAHHPTEIAATLDTAHKLHGTVAVVFQPHTYSRTAALESEFADALGQADHVVLAPVFAAREQKRDGVSSHSVCRRLIDSGKNAYCFDTFGEINEYCATLDADAVIYMGAGNIDIAAHQFIESDLYV